MPKRRQRLLLRRGNFFPKFFLDILKMISELTKIFGTNPITLKLYQNIKDVILNENHGKRIVKMFEHLAKVAI